MTVAARRRAAAVAGHTGNEQHARGALADPHRHVRATALTALDRLGVLTPEDLRQCLEDSEPTVRRRSCELAARHSAVNLIPALADTDSAVVEAAAWACGEQRPPQPGVVTALSKVSVESQDPLAREAAVAALGSLGDSAGLEAILGSLGDKAPVRRRAVLALAPFDGPEVTAALERSLRDRDWQVRQAAEDLLPDSQAQPSENQAISGSETSATDNGRDNR